MFPLKTNYLKSGCVIVKMKIGGGYGWQTEKREECGKRNENKQDSAHEVSIARRDVKKSEKVQSVIGDGSVGTVALAVTSISCGVWRSSSAASFKAFASRLTVSESVNVCETWIRWVTCRSGLRTKSTSRPFRV